MAEQETFGRVIVWGQVCRGEKRCAEGRKKLRGRHCMSCKNYEFVITCVAGGPSIQACGLRSSPLDVERLCPSFRRGRAA